MANCKADFLSIEQAYGNSKAKAKERAGVKAMFRGIDTLQDLASKDCPKGKRCLGQHSINAAPHFLVFKMKGKKKKKGKFLAIAFLNMSYVGECSSERAAAGPAPEKPVEGKDCVKRIGAKGYRKFMKRVNALPKLPNNYDGPCCMFKKKSGPFNVPVCAGKCETNDCRLHITVDTKDNFVAWCECK